MSESCVFENRQRRFCEGRAAVARHQVARFAWNDQFPIAGNIRGDDGHTGGHGLHDGIGLPFVTAGEPEHVEMRHEPRQIGARAEKMHAIGHLAEPRVSLKLRAKRTIADRQQMGLIEDAF